MDNITLLQTFESCVNNLLLHGFPLPLDDIAPQLHLTHKRGYYGICRHVEHDGRLLHTIGINSDFVAKGTDKAITNTLYHELLHTLPGCQNHGRVWKSYATRVKILFGYDVKRVGGDKTTADYNSMR